MADTLTPSTHTLWDAAYRAGFAHIFADVKAMGDVKPDGSGITPLQAFFCGWYAVYCRRGGKQLLEIADLPTTITGIAAWLGRQRQTIYGWLASDWFNQLAIGSWIDQELMRIIPDALHQLHQNVNNPATSNAAIRLTFDLYQNRHTPPPAPEAMAAVQVNIEASDDRQRLLGELGQLKQMALRDGDHNAYLRALQHEMKLLGLEETEPEARQPVTVKVIKGVSMEAL